MTESNKSDFSKKLENKDSDKRSFANYSLKNRRKLALSIFEPGETKHLDTHLNSGTYIVFDLETTGGNPERNGITEIFAVRYKNGKCVDTFYSMVNPKIPIPPIVRKMTGITNSMVRNAPTIRQVMPEFVEFIGNDVLVSHNTIGDMKFVRHFSKKTTGKMVSNYFLCTHLLVEKLVPESPNKSLIGLSDFFELNPENKAHRAKTDAYLTLSLFKILLKRIKKEKVRTIAEAIRFQGDYESSLRLGWGIKKKDLKSLPNAPGIYYLYDIAGEVRFISSARDISREIRKLQNIQTLPKQLLKVVTPCTSLTYEETTDLYGAGVKEARALGEHEVRFDSGLWHQRRANFLYLTQEDDGMRLSIGPLVEGVVVALGPVNHSKHVTDFFENLFNILGHKISKNGVKLSPGQGKIIFSYLTKRLNISKLSLLRKGLSTLFSDWKSTKELMKSLDQLKIPGALKNINTFTGVVASHTHDGWGLYKVSRGITQGEIYKEGVVDLEELLVEEDLGQKLYKEMEKGATKMLHRQPLSSADAHEINRSLWWISSGSKTREGRFVSLKELKRYL